MFSITFTDKNEAPTEENLRKCWGSKYELWISISSGLSHICGTVDFEWKYYGKKNGWLGKNTVNKRNMFFLIPGESGFRLAFTFGEKAISKIRESNFPEAIIADLDNARAYAEGKTIQIGISDPSDVGLITKLIKIKHEN